MCWYHVYARQNEGSLLFAGDDDRHAYLDMLGTVATVQGWRCLGYCLMPNHVHLLIETPHPNLARGMQRLHGDYGRRFAAARGERGHVFGGRYGSVRVREDKQLWAVAAYVARNPVAAGLCETAEAWRWSSHRAMLGRCAPAWLDVGRLLELLGGSSGGDARKAYAAYVGSPA